MHTWSPVNCLLTLKLGYSTVAGGPEFRSSRDLLVATLTLLLPPSTGWTLVEARMKSSGVRLIPLPWIQPIVGHATRW